MNSRLPQTRVIGSVRGFPLAISGTTDLPWVLGYVDCDVVIRHYFETKAEATRCLDRVVAHMTRVLGRPPVGIEVVKARDE